MKKSGLSLRVRRRKRSMNAKIIGYGMYLPEKVLNNFDLEKMVDT